MLLWGLFESIRMKNAQHIRYVTLLATLWVPQATYVASVEGSLVDDDKITKDLEGSSLDVINVRIQIGNITFLRYVETQPNDTLEGRNFVFTAVRTPNSQICTLWFWCRVGIISYVRLCIFVSGFQNFVSDQRCYVQEFLSYWCYFLFLCWYAWQLLSYRMGIQEKIVPKYMLAFLVAGMRYKL